MPQTSTATRTADHLRNLFAKTGTAALVISLGELDFTAKTQPAPEVLLCRAWTIEELERRFPAAAKVVEQAFEEDEERLMAGQKSQDLDYVALLLSAIERLAA